ncbi:hypothetical protein [uncultured Clostridium sp.]|uniref:hypothetical protein n=1 Tax=uncultured Clostridium sp. TaxID=59620 RepID=UPI00261528E9|nr:hypothetical protein [uncultured Clostridium sp.]
MIRERKSYPIVKRYKSLLFWRECIFCNREFKRENGFIIEDLISINSLTTYSYCCPECAISSEEVKIKLKEKQTNNKFSNPYSYFPNSIMDEYD